MTVKMPGKESAILEWFRRDKDIYFRQGDLQHDRRLSAMFKGTHGRCGGCGVVTAISKKTKMYPLHFGFINKPWKRNFLAGKRVKILALDHCENSNEKRSEMQTLKLMSWINIAWHVAVDIRQQRISTNFIDEMIINFHQQEFPLAHPTDTEANQQAQRLNQRLSETR